MPGLQGRACSMWRRLSAPPQLTCCDRTFHRPWSVEETDPGLSSVSCLIRLRAQPALGRREGYLVVPRSWESLEGHSRDLTFCDALLSLLSVARGGGHPWRGVLHDAPHPLLAVAGDGVANSVARRNVIRIQSSAPHWVSVEHKTRQEFRLIRTG